MRASRKRWRWAIALSLLGTAITFGIGRAWPHERLLLERSIRVAAHWNGRHNEVWISDHEIASSDLDYSTNRAWIIYTDFRSGKTQRVPLKHLPIDSHAYILPSPDGRWALRCDGSQALNNRAIAVEVQTGRRCSWPELGNAYHYGNCWLADSHRWLEYTTLGLGYLTIRSVDGPNKSLRLSSPESRPRWATAEYVTSADHLLMIDQNIDDSNSQIEPQLTGLNLYEYRLLPSLVHLRTLHVKSPPEAKMLWAIASPDGDHIVWSCRSA